MFALRPFASSEQNFIECSTQGLLLFAGFGGLLGTDSGGDNVTTGLGTAVVYVTLVLAALLIVWAWTRDLAFFFGSKQVLLKSMALSSVRVFSYLTFGPFVEGP